jgi:hypothetical protein
MTSTNTTAVVTSNATGDKIIVKIGRKVVAQVKDSENIVANIDKAMKRAGWVRTTGMSPMLVSAGYGEPTRKALIFTAVKTA